MTIKAARPKHSVTPPFGKREETASHACEMLCVCPRSENSYAPPLIAFSLLTTVKQVKTLNTHTHTHKELKTKQNKNYVFGVIFLRFSLARQSSGRASKLAFLSAMPLWEQHIDYFTRKKKRNKTVYFLPKISNWNRCESFKMWKCF